MKSRSSLKIEKTVATNKKAYHEFAISDTYEAGIVLTGSEVKSAREGGVSLRESYAAVKDGEAYVFNMHIAPYEKAGAEKQDIRRPRKLLLHKKEILKIEGNLTQKGFTFMPLKMYFSNGRLKMELGLAKGKTLYDKRKTIAEKTAQREIEREIRQRQKSQ